MNQPIDELRQMLLLISRSLVDHPDEVRVDPICEGDAVTFWIHTELGDAGQLIGVGGRTARALRVLLQANAVKLRLRLTLNICSSKDAEAEPPELVG